MGKSEIEQLKEWLSDKFDKTSLDAAKQNTQIESLITRFDKYDEELFNVIVTVTHIENDNKKLRNENKDMKAHINELEAKLRAKNLRFYIRDKVIYYVQWGIGHNK